MPRGRGYGRSKGRGSGAKLASGKGSRGGTAAKTLATGSARGRKLSVGGQAVLVGKGK